MNRRVFLQSVLGLSAGSALPKHALELLEKTASLPYEEFVEFVHNDEWMSKYVSAAAAALAKAIDEEIVREFLKGKH